MKSLKLFTCLLLAAGVIFVSSTSAKQKTGKKTSKTVSIEGTYKFMYRKLPNGMEVKAPAIMGLQNFSHGYRNFNVMWMDSAGHHFSLSIVSKYKITDKEYTETLLYSVMNDEAGLIKKGITYNMKQTKSSPVKTGNGKISFKFPFDPPSVTFEGNKMIASAPGMFTDYWEKVK